MKLQKLCYYAQAWHLARQGKPLFQEDFLRWEDGPVCRELFNVHRGRFAIMEGDIPKGYASAAQFTEEELYEIHAAMENYGKYGGAELSKMTHAEDPWKNSVRNEVITKEEIKNYYFDRWGEDCDDGEPELILTHEDIERSLKEAENGKIYESAEELLRDLHGHAGI
ncbi:MAG: DUF4065 domain-containing protein [Puniceicoccales bacterium]|nr:DUF4065 domain-containing protein [Puniceicoccales bacterium]